VQRFQRRHGLNPSGSVDGETLDELNVTPAERVKTLIVNLERWRWLPEDRTVSKQVWVNIAGFELVTLSQHQFTLRSPVVVGKRYLSTPLFSSYIKEIKFNPDLTVPTSIVTKELLPKIRKDPTYLAKEHMRILDSNGHELPPSALHTDQRLSGIQIRQDPGPWNALGRIKFVFPNRYGVYLHDTPSRSLFSREQRALSHGCIRVDEAHSLARSLLDEPDDRWTAERINELVEAKKTITVRLRQPVRINVSYRTAWVDADGILNFRPDIYGRDARMKDVLFDGEALLRDRVDISPFS
jgi:murein L,D-transpeptidase YcbB/YkuD